MVQRAPARPRVWLRIARTKAFLGHPQEEVIQAWKMSVLTGRVEPTLMLARLELGLRYFAGLDNESIALLRDQAVLSWSVQKKQLMRGLASGSLNIELLRELLSGTHQHIIAEMEAR